MEQIKQFFESNKPLAIGIIATVIVAFFFIILLGTINAGKSKAVPFRLQRFCQHTGSAC